MKFRKSKKESIDGKKMEELNWKREKDGKMCENELKIECFKCEGKGHYAFECPSKKKNKKAMQVTQSDSESNQLIEKESNGSEEYTNFIAFSTSVNEEPLFKEASSELSESSDSNDDNMSFDIAYDTLYKECLSLKQEQVKWKASKKILTNEVVLNGEKKALLDKIAFLENLHLEVKKKCDVLKSGNQIFKDELSIRKKRVTSQLQLINSRRNLLIKEAQDFLVEMLLKVVVKQFLLSIAKNNFLRKLIPKSTFITIIVEKWDTFN